MLTTRASAAGRARPEGNRPGFPGVTQRARPKRRRGRTEVPIVHVISDRAFPPGRLMVHVASLAEFIDKLAETLSIDARDSGKRGFQTWVYCKCRKCTANVLA